MILTAFCQNMMTNNYEDYRQSVTAAAGGLGNMSTKIGMVSLGCAKNRVDAEMLLFTLKQAGFELVADPAMSDVAIVNTCGFIEDAKQESIDEILELAELKKEGRIQAIIVSGCLAERYQKEILKELYEVDAVIGIGANGKIVDVVNKVLEGKRVESFPDKLCLDINGWRIRTTPFYYAYLKIAEGCDNCCTYCAIPNIRGKYRSRRIEDIVEEARTLVGNGVRELVIVAQDTSRYGEDLYNKLMLPELLREICKIDKDFYVRVLYCYPDRITDELIDTIANEPKVLKYIDLPLQHASGKILKRMNRHGDRQILTELIKKLRDRIPKLVIRTTFMTGFPGETEEDFIELSEFVRDMRFERMGCFAYSQEEDTPAASFDDQISDEVKKHRHDIIMEQQSQIMAENCVKMIGKTVKILFEGFDRYAECYYGRSAADAPEVDGKVFFTVEGKKPNVGDIIEIAITDYVDVDLIGEYKA